MKFLFFSALVLGTAAQYGVPLTQPTVGEAAPQAAVEVQTVNVQPASSAYGQPQTQFVQAPQQFIPVQQQQYIPAQQQQFIQAQQQFGPIQPQYVPFAIYQPAKPQGSNVFNTWGGNDFGRFEDYLSFVGRNAPQMKQYFAQQQNQFGYALPITEEQYQQWISNPFFVSRANRQAAKYAEEIARQ